MVLPGETPIGSFVSWRVIDGARYEVFGRHGDADGFAHFDIYDEAGNHINEEVVLELPPGERMIRGLILRWHARRTVLVLPSTEGWRVVWVGDKVRLALAHTWWPH